MLRFPLALLIAAGICLMGSVPAAHGAGKSAGAIDSLEDIMLGGVRQKILIEGNDPSCPILLWLHGGPGSSQMLLSHYYSKRLRDHFILVNWDTRGTALSYGGGGHAETLSFSQLISDTEALTRYLCRRFGRRKIFLLGHSFGSILGLHVVKRSPRYYYAYVGMGQVIDPARSAELARRWLEGRLREAGDTEGLSRLEASAYPPMDLIERYGGMRHRPTPTFNEIVQASPYYFEGYLDLHARSRVFVENNLKGAPADNFGARLIELGLPVLFFLGRHDRCPAASPELVVEYYDKLRAPAKRLVWFAESAHHPNLEQPEEFQEALIEQILPFAS